MSNVLMDRSLHSDTQHRAVDLPSYQFIREIINTSNLNTFEAIFRWNTWRRLSTAIHNPLRVMEWSNRLRYSWFSIRSSARSDLLLVSHETLLTMQQRLPMIFLRLLLNQEHGINNERSQSIQSVRHSRRTHRMWPHQKDRNAREKRRRKKAFLAHSAQLVYIYIYIYISAWRSDTVTDARFLTVASILKS